MVRFFHPRCFYMGMSYFLISLVNQLDKGCIIWPFQIWMKSFESGLIASRISNDTTEEIVGRWEFVKQLQSLYRFKQGVIGQGDWRKSPIEFFGGFHLSINPSKPIVLNVCWLKGLARLKMPNFRNLFFDGNLFYLTTGILPHIIWLLDSSWFLVFEITEFQHAFSSRIYGGFGWFKNLLVVLHVDSDELNRFWVFHFLGVLFPQRDGHFG